MIANRTSTVIATKPHSFFTASILGFLRLSEEYLERFATSLTSGIPWLQDIIACLEAWTEALSFFAIEIFSWRTAVHSCCAHKDTRCLSLRLHTLVPSFVGHYLVHIRTHQLDHLGQIEGLLFFLFLLFLFHFLFLLLLELSLSNAIFLFEDQFACLVYCIVDIFVLSGRNSDPSLKVVLTCTIFHHIVSVNLSFVYSFNFSDL